MSKEYMNNVKVVEKRNNKLVCSINLPEEDMPVEDDDIFLDNTQYRVVGYRNLYKLQQVSTGNAIDDVQYIMLVERVDSYSWLRAN